MKELKAIAILKNLMLSPKARFSITSKMAKEALLELEQMIKDYDETVRLWYNAAHRR